MELKQKQGKWLYTATSEELLREFRFGNVTENGIIYMYELSGPNGADFYLFPSQRHKKKDIEEAKEDLRTQHDVTGIFIGKCIGKYPIPWEPPVWTPEQREEGFRKIVRGRSFDQVENIPMCDLTTAGMVCSVMDALSPENKAKYLTFNALAMVNIGWELLDRAKSKGG